LDSSGFIESKNMPTTLIAGKVMASVWIERITVDRPFLEVDLATKTLHLGKSRLVSAGVVDPSSEQVSGMEGGCGSEKKTAVETARK
jgi:hypothetical protein